MIGLKVKRADDGAMFTVVAVDGNDDFVLSPEEFGSPVTVPLAVLSADFNVKLEDVTLPPTEQQILRACDAAANRTINATYARAVLGNAKPPREQRPPGETPEDVFRRMEDS